MQLTTGQYRSAGQIFGSYRCLALLGEGGMGHVYLAEHIRLGRKVALKRLKDRVASEPDAVAQFMTEAQAVNRIHHPHIVDITDFCNDEAGVYYLMELLEGRTVADVLRKDGPLTERRVLYIGHQVADALEAAHKADVLHLDIKPSNIFLTSRDGQVDYTKLLDFGIARLRDAATPQLSDDQASDMGPVTPAFMAPEQATTRPVDHRTDIYSMGAVLYAMLAGRPPFEAQTLAEFVHKHLAVEPTPLTAFKDLPTRVSAPCSRLVMRCMQKRPADRPQSARELRDLLARVAETSCGIRLVPGRPPETAPTRLVWRRWGLVAAALVVVIGAVVAVYFGLRGGGPSALKGSAGGEPGGKVESAPPGASTSARVELRVVSEPTGAEVFRLDGATRLLGLTPMRVKDLPRTGVLELRLRRRGYLDLAVRVNLVQGDQTVRVVLHPRAPARGVAPLEPRSRTVSMGALGPGARGSVRRVRPPPMRPPPMRPGPSTMGPAMKGDTGATVDPFER